MFKKLPLISNVYDASDSSDTNINQHHNFNGSVKLTKSIRLTAGTSDASDAMPTILDYFSTRTLPKLLSMTQNSIGPTLILLNSLIQVLALLAIS